LTSFDVIVVGGGASGLMCAMTAGQRDRRVLILEGSNKIGKKILMSGGGRCNFTNRLVEPANFLSANPHFCISALDRYTSWDFIALVEKHGIAYHERRHGQLFCDDSAKDILAMLAAECAQVGVRIHAQCMVRAVQAPIGGDDPARARFRLDTDQGEFSATSLVIATGGLSIPKMGASGFGYDIARQFGHTVLPTRAGLVPFTFSNGFKAIGERLSGLAVEASLSVPEACFRENILFTHRGLSGPAALQLSNYWTLGAPIRIDLFPGESVQDWLKMQKKARPRLLLRTLLGERLARGLLLELQSLFWPAWAETAIADIPDAALVQLADDLQAWTVKPSGTEGYRTAEVTLGGVDTRELSSRTMESKRQPGLYFIGEVVDVTGWLGGFNLQWAWSSGHAAGQFA
jgi:predicted Rossmann fold flavoprotein